MDCIVRKIKQFSGIDKKSFYNSIHCTHALTMVQQRLYQVQIELFWISMKIQHAFALKIKTEWLYHLNESFKHTFLVKKKLEHFSKEKEWKNLDSLTK